MNSKGWSSRHDSRAGSSAAQHSSARRVPRSLDLPPCNCKEWVSTNLARDREPPLRPCRGWRVGEAPQASYLKESDTRVRNAATLPFSNFMSICVTFGHAQVAQRAGCRFHRAATSILPRFVADADDFDDLVDRIRLLLRHGILRRLDCARSREARGDGNSIRGSNLRLDAAPSPIEWRECQRREPSALIRNQHWKRRKRRIVPARAWAGASHCRVFDSGSCQTPHLPTRWPARPGHATCA